MLVDDTVADPGMNLGTLRTVYQKIYKYILSNMAIANEEGITYPRHIL